MVKLHVVHAPGRHAPANATSLIQQNRRNTRIRKAPSAGQSCDA
jgi:hypothetical protein